MAKAGRKATAVLVTVIALAAAANTSAHDDPIAAADQPGPTLVLHVANYAALPREVLDAAKARVAGVYEVIGVRTCGTIAGRPSAGFRTASSTSLCCCCRGI